MAQLYGTLASDTGRSVATKAGGKWISSHTRGWNEGCEVNIAILDNGKVVTEVWRTGGSNAARSRELVASWVEGESRIVSAHPDMALKLGVR